MTNDLTFYTEFGSYLVASFAAGWVSGIAVLYLKKVFELLR